MLTETIYWEGVFVATPIHEGQGIHCLIGRDILAHAVLIDNGPAKPIRFA